MPLSSSKDGSAELFGGAVPGDAGSLEVVNVKKFLESRCLEIEELLTTLKRSEKQDRIFQRLPFILRRRGTSHNPFRVPKRLRLHLAREMAKSMPKCAKRLRKDVRRRLNRLEEYRSRCKRNQWLETHLYHAKRFKMATLWGHRLAYCTAQKCRRRCLRYCKRRCVIHDLSYVRVVSVSGTLPVLRQAFRSVFADSSLMFQDRLLSGEYQSQCYSYSSSGGSCRMICPTRFIWIVPCHSQMTSDEVREIWLFVHPAAIDEFVDTLNNSSDDLECRVVKDLCTFEIMGPLAALLLRATLKVDGKLSTGNALWKRVNLRNVDVPPSYVLPLRVMMPVVHGNLRPQFKVKSMCDQHFGSGCFSADLVSPDERRELHDFKVSADFEIVTKVDLPRLRRRNYASQVSKLLESLNVRQPNGKDKVDGVRPGTKNNDTNTSTSSDEAQDCLMDSSHDIDIHKNMTEDAMDSSKYTDDTVPVWLIRRGDALGGFDIVIPAGTIARKLWILLNRYGAMGIAQREREMIYAEYGQCSFPQDYPDTLSGQSYLRAAES
ncbi:Ribonucleases P/MRP protein subunit POP1 [Babesia sp. Xinjiang]|uniref:Ribonucleases P/MRP protein subunit POP1 n=1 Tax=Babesia sp. Xinjiang TaxID=462227 RepID=UPI000A26351C|nr:Ribonucleases P/MRP protein subunit POP1 [Babesia sp. Xinjiang]XP_028872594.1 Ribonucleases P/MRP protein subunit POP1 [Babesia sp. Xinjiang]ORM42101.1 Ribonucleases P/MRP protein subunit POP1 [Babesia sp. Xinjiang]ORM42138.1 Ribonucleases P/MRP protein subunit POP1 [Babesia sp. Xinjiang]